MGYQIVQFPKLGAVTVQGSRGPEVRREPLPDIRPRTGRCIWSDLSGLTGDDPTRRVEVWVTPDGTATADEVLAAAPAILQEKQDKLLAAAQKYEAYRISGSGLGLLTMGVAAGLPKCTAVSQWLEALWLEYYRRKAGITIDGDPDCDFSEMGEMPYSVPELIAEVAEWKAARQG